MADLIEIGIEVRGRDGIRGATREIDALGNSVKSAERSASAFIQAFAQQERQLNAAANANRKFTQTQQEAARASQVFYNSLQQVNLANKSAADSFAVYEKRIDQLRAKYNPLYASSKQYETMLNEINEAHRVGALTTKQFEAAQERLTQQFTNGTGVFSKYASQTSQRLNQMGVVTQQVGYQVGDFLVQVQSGTNFLVAFGQQATQLVGILPLMGAGFMGLSQTALVGLSAGLGIVIPLVTAVGAAIWRAGSSSEEASPKIKTTADILGDLTDATKDAETELRLLHSVFKDIEALTAQDKVKEINTEIMVLNQEIGKISSAALSGFGAAGGILSGEDLQRLSDAAIKGRVAVLEEEKKILEEKLQQYLAAQKLLEIEESYKELMDELAEIEKNTSDIITETLQGLRERQQLAEAYLQGGEAAVDKEQELLDVMALVRELQSDKYDLSDAELSAILQQVKAAQDLEAQVNAAKIAAENLASSLQTAAAAMSQLTSFSDGLDKKIAQAAAKVAALKAGVDVANAATIAGLKVEAAQKRDAAAATAVGAEQLRTINKEYADSLAKIKELEGLNTTFETLTEEQKKAAAAARAGSKALKDQEKAAEALRKELEGPMVSAVGSISDAFGDFIARGLTDFKGFVKSILTSFQNMISQMIAMAVKNRIMLSLGIGGVTPAAAAAGQVAGLGTASTMLGSIGTGTGLAGIAGGTGFLGGAANTISGLAGGGAGFFNIGANAAAAGGGFLASVGAAIPVLAAAAAVFSFFRTKTKELDSGLKVTIDNMDTLVQTFRTVEKSRFWGLSKKISTTIEDAEQEVADPLIKAVTGIQTSVMNAAETLGISSDVFEDFFYEFDVSLKGLTEDQKMEKINAELLKMGDSFASLAGSFSGMYDLIATASMLREGRRFAQQKNDLKEAMEMVPYFGTMLGAGLSSLQRVIGASGLTGENREQFASAVQEFADNMDLLGRINAILNTTFSEDFVSLSERLRRNVLLIEDVRGEFVSIISTFQDEFNIVTTQGIKGLGQTANNLSKLVPYVEGAGEAIEKATNAVNWFGGYMQSFISGAGSVAEQVNGYIKDLFGNIGGERGVGSPVDETQSIAGDIQNRLSVFTKTVENMNAQFGNAAMALRELQYVSVQVEVEIRDYESRGFDAPESLITFYNEVTRQIERMSESAAVAKAKVDMATNFLSTVSRSTVEFEQAIADAIVAPIEEALTLYLPDQLQNLSNRIRTSLAGLSEGDITAFQNAYLVLVEEFANQNVAVETFNETFSLMKEVLAGNVSLTDELTSKQLEGANALKELSDRLNGFLGIVREGIQDLLGISTGTTGGISVSASESYLRSIISGGRIDETLLTGAVSTLTSLSQAQFATEVDYLRTVGRTTELLRQVEATIGGRAPDAGPMNEQLGITPYNPSPMIQPNRSNLGDADVKIELASMRADLNAALIQIAKNTRKSADTLNKFDYQGLPDNRGY